MSTLPIRHSRAIPAAWLMALWALVAGPRLAAQTILNPGFESGTTGWNGCPMELNAESVYGGSSSTNHVVEVDGHNDPAITTDDMVLCQTITGLTMDRTYDLSFQASRRTTGATPATVTCTAQVGSVSKTFSRSGAWSWKNETVTFLATASSLSLMVTPNFTGSLGMIFDDFTVALHTTLPIELLAFEASSLQDRVRLGWTTASEQNNERFDVERSTDLQSWMVAASVPGAGDSQSTLTYTADDPRAPEGTVYYRLRQIDHDGASSLSDVEVVHHSATQERVIAWPQPAGDELSLRLPGVAGWVQVTDALGRPCAVPWRSSDGVLIVDVNALRAGHYVLHAEADGRSVVPFVKH